MDVLVSGKAGLAALITGDDALLVDRNGETVCESNYVLATNQFRAYDDTLFIESLTHRQAIKTLKCESDKSDALLMTLTVLDSNVQNEPKVEIIRLLDDLFVREETINYVQGILYARPFEENAIRKLPEFGITRQSITLKLIDDLISSQEKITHIYHTWMQVADSFDTGSDDLKFIEGVFVKNQVNYELCKEKITKNESANLKFLCLTQLNKIPSSRQIITKLFNTADLNVIETKKVVNTPEVKIKKHNQIKNKPIQIHKKFEQVNSQIKKIKTFLIKGDNDHALKFAEELIQSQIDRNENDYAAMTLCQLSEEAKNIEDYSLQLEWAKKATDINPHEGRVHGHLADAYLNLGRLNDAEITFKVASELGDYSYGKSGLARIERARHNYPLALKLINKVIDEQPDCANQRLKAEIYRDIGQLEKAAKLYKKLMEEYYEDATPMCGYAAVLTDQNKFTEAEVIYRKAVELYPKDQISSTGLGFLLAKMGKFNEAIKYLNQAIKNAKTTENIPHLAKAKALQIYGKYQQAEKIYNKLISINHNRIDPWLDLIELFATSNNIEKAHEALFEAKKIFETKNALLLSEALIFKNEEKYSEALHLLDKLKASSPKWEKVLILRADVLKYMSDFEEARCQYTDVLEFNSYSKRAQIGIQIINSLDDKITNTKEKNTDINDVVVIDDLEQIYINGLLLLVKNQIENAKKVLLGGYKNNPFKPLKEKFSVSLDVANDPIFNIEEAKNLLLAA